MLKKRLRNLQRTNDSAPGAHQERHVSLIHLSKPPASPPTSCCSSTVYPKGTVKQVKVFNFMVGLLVDNGLAGSSAIFLACGEYKSSGVFRLLEVASARFSYSSSSSCARQWPKCAPLCTVLGSTSGNRISWLTAVISEQQQPSADHVRLSASAANV